MSSPQLPAEPVSADGACAPGEAPPRAGASLARNAACNIAGECLWGLSANLVYASTVLVVALQHFGAGTVMIGSITAIEAGAATLPQLLGMYLFRSHRRRKAQLIWWHVLVMIPALPLMGLAIFLSHHVPAAAVRWMLLGGFAWFSFTIGAIMSVWWDWMAHLFPQKTRGRVLGASFAGSAATGALGAAIAAAIIKGLGEPQAFGALYVLAGAAAWLSMLAFVFTVDPATSVPDTPLPPLREQMAHFRTSLADGNFRRYLVGRSLAVWGFGITPLIADYFLSEGVDKATVVGAVVATMLASAATHFVIGWIGDHAGFRVGMLLGVVVQIGAVGTVLLFPTPLGCVIAFAGVGAANSAGFLSHTNLLIESCRHSNRLAHMTLGNMVLAPVSISGPLLAGAAAKFAGHRVVFVACLCFSAAALAWLLTRVRDPRSGAG